MSERYDAIVIGAGLSGQACVRRLRAGGTRVALVERADIGGETRLWASMPQEGILGPDTQLQRSWALPSQHLADFHDDLSLRPSNVLQQEHLAGEGITILRGIASIADVGHVRVEGRMLETEHIVIAAGTKPRVPEIKGLAQAGFWTSREAVSVRSVPASIVVLGDGAEAIELAQMFRLYSSEVTLIAQGHRLVLYEDPAAARLLAQHLHGSGVRLVFGRDVRGIARESDGRRVVTLDDGSCVHGHVLLLAADRTPYTTGLGLEHTAVRVGARGIQVDEYCRAAEGIWAIGDITGGGSFVHMAQYQACIAADDILGHPHAAYYRSVPRIAFTEPQLAATGLTLAQAHEEGRDINSLTVDLDARHKPRVPDKKDVHGELTLHVDRQRGVVVGAWAVGPDAGEWIELAVLAIRAAIPIAVLHDTFEQVPKFSEIYHQALDLTNAQDGEHYSTRFL
jgi:pyruvate/2-oxoglutarate dehydrogenase complex dihydrolipoamide dehydrogenase (E3) component